ncbi:MAG: hypothetical protein GY940_32045 [bacterium]|nr:hypothetical protein [bacterium]
MKVVEDKSSSPVGNARSSDPDERLGRLLSNGLSNGEAPAGSCLTSGEIAALVEGNITGSQRDRMMKHLSACNSCYDIFLLAADLHEDENAGLVRKVGPGKFLKPLALAASVLIVVFSIYILYNPKGDSIPKTAEDLMNFAATSEEAETTTAGKRIPPTVYKGGGAAKDGDSMDPVPKKKRASMDSRKFNTPGAPAKKSPKKKGATGFSVPAEQPETESKNKLDGKKAAKKIVPVDKNRLEADHFDDSVKSKQKAPVPLKVGRVDRSGEKADKEVESEDTDKRPLNKPKSKVRSKVPTQQQQFQQQQYQQQQLKRQQVGEQQGQTQDVRQGVVGLEENRQQVQKKQEEQKKQELSESIIIAREKPVTRVQGKIKAEGGYSEAFARNRVKRLNHMAVASEGYLPAVRIKPLFRETLVLANRLEVSVRVKKGGKSKLRSMKDMDESIPDAHQLKPLIRVIHTSDNFYTFPNIKYFLSRSAPGTVENRFFKLAYSGWCTKDGTCYSSGGSVIGWKNPDGKTNAKLLKQWEALLPKLTGSLKEIAQHTIEHLKNLNK